MEMGWGQHACGMRWDGDGDNEDNVGIETTSVNVGGMKTSSRELGGDGVVILHPQFEKPQPTLNKITIV